MIAKMIISLAYLVVCFLTAEAFNVEINEQQGRLNALARKPKYDHYERERVRLRHMIEWLTDRKALILFLEMFVYVAIMFILLKK